MSDKRLIVVVGPTGSGKTDLSIRLALNYDAPILSTDSRQVYRGPPIGTAQPAPEQLQTVEHHFIASHDINDNLNCGEYETQALARLGELFAAHDYVGRRRLRTLRPRLVRRHGRPSAGRRNPAAESAARLASEGVERLAEELRTLDPAYYVEVDRSNPARVVRALEVCLLTGLPYSGTRGPARAASAGSTS